MTNGFRSAARGGAALAAAGLVAACVAAPEGERASVPSAGFVEGPDGLAVSDALGTAAVYHAASYVAGEPARAHYLHPVFSPSGRVLTEDQPEDHVHHRGFYWGWRRLLVDGEQVADSWVLDNVWPDVRDVRTEVDAEGRALLLAAVDWRAGSPEAPGAVFMQERSRWTFAAPEPGVRTIAVHAELVAQVDGLALAGSDDFKGYSGVTLRLIDPDHLNFASAGAPLVAVEEPIATDGTVAMWWDEGADYADVRVTMSCRADGAAVEPWIIRRWGSAQNCIWPGRAPFVLPTDAPVVLEADVRIEETLP